MQTASEYSATMRRLVWDVLDRLRGADDLDALNTIFRLLHSTPSGVGQVDELAQEREQFRAQCRQAFNESLERADTRAQVRHLAAHPKRAKGYTRMIEMVLRERPEVFTEAETGPAVPATDSLTDLDKSSSPGGAHRGSFYWIKREIECAGERITVAYGGRSRAEALAGIRAKCAAAYYERREVLRAVAEDPKASRVDRARARSVLRKYGNAPPAPMKDDARPNGET